MDLDYYKNYIRFNNTPQSDVSEMSDSYSQQLSDAISTFSIRINSNEAIDIKINDPNSLTTYKALLSTRKLKNETENSTTKSIQINLNTISCGDYIYFNDETYLIATKTEDKPIYNPDHTESIVRLCNNNLKFIADINGVDTILSVPCVVGDMNLNLEEVKYVTTQNNIMVCSVGTAYIDKIKYIDDGDNPTRFIINNKAYKVVGIDNASGVLNGEGIIAIKLESDQLNEQFDDTYNGIADRWSVDNVKPEYTFEYYKELTFSRYEEVRYDFVIKNNGVIVTNPTLIKVSSNTSVVAYQNYQWITVGYGTCNFTITFAGLDGITYTNVIKINVVVPTAITYSYAVTTNDGLFNLEQYIGRIYTCNRYQNGKGVPSEYNITIDYNGNPTNIIGIETITDNSIQIRNLNGINNETIYIVFTDILTNIVTRQAVVLTEF